MNYNHQKRQAVLAITLLLCCLAWTACGKAGKPARTTGVGEPRRGRFSPCPPLVVISTSKHKQERLKWTSIFRKI